MARAKTSTLAPPRVCAASVLLLLAVATAASAASDPSTSNSLTGATAHQTDKRVGKPGSRVPPTLCRSGCLRFPRFSKSACPRKHCRFVSCEYSAVGKTFPGHICIRKFRRFPGCFTPCQKWWSVASAHCGLKRCRVARCRLGTGLGWRCQGRNVAVPNFATKAPTVTVAATKPKPSPLPPADPKKCFKGCDGSEAKARVGCDSRVCRVVKCPVDNILSGFACRALSTPPPSPCNEVCFVAGTRAGVPTSVCDRDACTLAPCKDRGDRGGFRCVNKTSR